MGAPSIDISFIEKAISAITRGERGIVMLWVKDTLPAPAINPATVVTESDIPAGLSDPILMDWQDQYSKNGYLAKSILHIQCNPHQNSNSMLQRIMALSHLV